MAVQENEMNGREQSGAGGRAGSGGSLNQA